MNNDKEIINKLNGIQNYEEVKNIYKFCIMQSTQIRNQRKLYENRNTNYIRLLQ